jgi:hypothetical protein
MSELLDRHLEDVAIQMGGYLRGFNDSAIHLGTPAQFAREFRRVLDEPILHASGDKAISYAQASEYWHLRGIETEAVGPIATLVRGLRGKKVKNMIAIQEISAKPFYEDLQRLLRLPRLRIFLTAPKPRSLQCSVQEIAERMALSYTFGMREQTQTCPSCGNSLIVDSKNSPAVCPHCGIEFETFIEQPIVPSVFTVISYDMLHELLALDLVETYQEESAIRPTQTSEAALDKRSF